MEADVVPVESRATDNAEAIATRTQDNAEAIATQPDKGDSKAMELSMSNLQRDDNIKKIRDAVQTYSGSMKELEPDTQGPRNQYSEPQEQNYPSMIQPKTGVAQVGEELTTLACHWLKEADQGRSALRSHDDGTRVEYPGDAEPPDDDKREVDVNPDDADATSEARLAHLQRELRELKISLQIMTHEHAERIQDQIQGFNRALCDQTQTQEERLEEVKSQKIYAGCNLTQSQILSEMARRDCSVYYALEPDSRRRKRDLDFSTDLRDYQRVLELKKCPFEDGMDLVGWFSEFDDWADQYRIPQQARYARLTTGYLSARLREKFLMYNAGHDEPAGLTSYSDLKQWLYGQYDSKAAIERAQEAIFRWRRDPEQKLQLAYDDFLFYVRRYCRELRFALDFGINLGQVVKPPEGALFAHFLNHLGNAHERQQVWRLFQDVGGAKRLDILHPICRRIDDILRPGLGIHAFITSASAALTYPDPVCSLYVAAAGVSRAYRGATRRVDAQCPICAKHGIKSPWHPEMACGVRYPQLQREWKRKQQQANPGASRQSKRARLRKQARSKFYSF